MAKQNQTKALNPKAMLASIRDTYGIDGRYYRFGVGDNFPNLLAEYVNDSGTAKSCIDKLNQFTYGMGLKSDLLAKEFANPSETWEEVVKQIIPQINYFGGFAIQVKFDAAGRPARYYKIDIQHIRKRFDGNFIYNENLGDPAGFSLHKKFNNVIIPPFRVAYNAQEEAQLAPRRRELVKSQMKEYGQQYGELLYVYTKGVGLNYQYYPVPTYASGLNDLAADAGLSVHEDSSVNNGFRAGVIISTPVLDRGTKDEEGFTEGERFDNTIDGFTSPSGSPVAHLEIDLSDGQVPTITPLNIQHQMDATEKGTDRIGKKVCRWFGVPPVLVGIDTAGKLGDNQELVNKFKLFNLTIDTGRDLVAKMFEKVMPDLPSETYEMPPLNLFDYVPDKVIETMTTEQKNEVFGLPAPDSATANKRVYESSDITAATEAVSAFNRDEVTYAQAKTILTVMLGFTEEQAVKMLGTEPINTAEPLPTTEVAAPQAEAPKVNDVFTNLTGKQMQNVERIIRKFEKQQINEPTALMMLGAGYGLTEAEARKLLNLEDAIIN